MTGLMWVQRQDMGPAPRSLHDLAFDPGRGRLVLFGGSSLNPGGRVGGADDTWEWDQGHWIQVEDAGPSARAGAKLAYDPGGAVLLLFGGGADAATWAWDGARWKQVADTGPSATQGHALATTDGGVILFGGAAAAAPPDPAPLRNDTWAWFDQAWRQIADIGPAPRLSHAMAYDPAGKIIAFGGRTAQGMFLGDTWELAQHA